MASRTRSVSIDSYPSAHDADSDYEPATNTMWHTRSAPTAPTTGKRRACATNQWADVRRARAQSMDSCVSAHEHDSDYEPSVASDDGQEEQDAEWKPRTQANTRRPTASATPARRSERLRKRAAAGRVVAWGKELERQDAEWDRAIEERAWRSGNRSEMSTMTITLVRSINTTGKTPYWTRAVASNRASR